MVSLLPHHKYFWIYKSLRDKEYDLLISNEILSEYYEKLTEKYGLTNTNNAIEVLLTSTNVQLISPSYRFLLIKDDPDDDKFVDCAVAGNADFIVSHDKHYNILKEVSFPKVNVIKIPEFKEVLEDLHKHV
jgi:putative PIN family toxin of toxin-antitoxin system